MHLVTNIQMHTQLFRSDSRVWSGRDVEMVHPVFSGWLSGSRHVSKHEPWKPRGIFAGILC